MITIYGNCLLVYAKKGKYLNQKQSMSFTAVFKQQSWRIPDCPCATGEELSSRHCDMYVHMEATAGSFLADCPLLR